MQPDLHIRHCNCVGPGTADAIRLLVEETFGPGYWLGFQGYMVEPDVHGKEWRFGGLLGFGGKVHLNAGRLYVSCYPGDEDGFEMEILRVNEKLEEMVSNG